MFREETLANEARRRIYQFVLSNPGLHLRELQRQLDTPLSSLNYHLNYLVKQDILYSEDDGFYIRFFDEELEARNREVLSVLRQKRLREVLLVVLSQTKISYIDLKRRLQLPASTLSLYLKKLVEHNLLERHSIGRESFYVIKDEARIAGLLVLYKTSFMDRLIDNALSVLVETSFKSQLDQE